MTKVLGRRVTGSLAATLLFESSLIVGAVALGAWLRLGQDAWLVLTVEHGFEKALLIAAVCQLCLYYADLYNPRMISDRRELFVRSVQALGATSFLLAAIYFWLPQLIIGRGVFLIATTLVIVVVIGWRLAFEWFISKVAPRERLLLVGTSPAAVDLARELYEIGGQIGVEIVGFVDPDPARVGAPVINPGVIGTIEDIPAIVRARDVDRVVVSLADARGTLPMDKLLEMKLDGVPFDHLASVYEEYTGKIAVENLRPSWLIFSDGFRKSRLARRRQARRSTSSCAADRSRSRCADHGAAWRSRVQAHLAGPGALSPAARRPARPRLHRPQVPVDAAGRRGTAPARCGRQGGRSAHDAGRPVPAADAARRAAAALERPERRHEPRRAAARASGVRHVS